MTENQGQRYDKIAQGFADMRDQFSTEQKYIDILISYLKPGASILDVGCGSGYPIAAYLLEKGFEVTGIDGSKELLKIAQSRHPTFNCLFGDIRTVNIAEKYDAVLEWWCLFHLPKEDHAAMIARFASWLKPGGYLEFTTGAEDHEVSSDGMLNQELYFYSLAPEQYELYLKQNGFKLLLKERHQEQNFVWIAQLEGA
jgi:2-polyprenyl-3-methyl-5-hydroxy-6-metoxy-1,4-benzoquinol methylase